MNPNLYVPACCKFIHKKDGTLDYQRIYGVAKSAYHTKYPDKELSSLELLEFLQLNRVIPAEIKEQDIDPEYQELCFSIISQYRCNSICQLCTYSPLYKNVHENEEAFLLGYVMSDWNHLVNLKSSGITCRHFRAMIPVSQQSAVLVVPLNRLAFEYLETIPKSQSDLHSIADKIIDAIKKNNKNKLSAADIKIAHKYLLNLSDKNYQHLDSEKIDAILRRCFQLTLKQVNSQQSNSPAVPNQPDRSNNDQKKNTARNSVPADSPTITGAACLEGFLSSKKPAASGKKTVSQTDLPQKVPNHSKTAMQAQQPLKAQKTDIPETAAPMNKDKSGQKQPVQTGQKDTLSTYKKNSMDTETPPVNTNMLERFPQLWHTTRQDLSALHVIDLDKADYLQIEAFLWKLLQTPLLPTEIVTVDKNVLLLLYTRQSFYSFSITNSLLLDKILPYVNRSKYRRLICYEPYMLYNFFMHQDIYSIQLFSLRIAADFTEAQYDWSISATDLVQKTTGAENVLGILDVMPYYYEMYRKYSDKLESLPADHYAEYRNKVFLSHIIGKSFSLNAYSSSTDYLIKKETVSGFKFSFSGSEKMKSPYLAISYRFSWEESYPFPVTNLLNELFSHSILEKHNIFLLALHENEIILSITSKEYSFLCDLINRLSSLHVKTLKTSPITIDETVLDGRLA